MVEVGPRIRYPRELARIGYVYAVAGKRDEAIRILKEMKALTGKRHNLGAGIAAIYGESRAPGFTVVRVSGNNW